MTVSIVPGWTADDIPDLTGVRAVVTGAASGLGEATAVELARHGARVVLTARYVQLQPAWAAPGQAST